MIPSNEWLPERKQLNVDPPAITLPEAREFSYEDDTPLRVGPRRVTSQIVGDVEVELETHRRENFIVYARLRSLYAMCLIDRIE